MKQNLLSLFTRTPMHIGAGSSVGAVDLPVIRERHTDYPSIPGSSLKGVLADLWRAETEFKKENKEQRVRKEDSELELLFGVDRDPKNARAGKLLIGQGKLLAFPVRSAKGGFAWLSCPLALSRYQRDAGLDLAIPRDLAVESCLAAESMAIKNQVILEDYCLARSGAIDDKLVTALAKLSADKVWQEEVAAHLVIVSDEFFSHFARNACEVAQHVKINPNTGTAEPGALFSQENVPSETLFYAVINELAEGMIQKLDAKLSAKQNLLQVGADASTGLGWCSVNLMKHNG